MTHLRYDQRYRGLEVAGRQLLLHLRDGAVIAANGHFADGIELETTPTVSETGARSPAGAPTLLVHVNGLDRARLAWRVTVADSEPLGVWRVFVDARTGKVLRAYDDLRTAKNRVRHAGSRLRRPGLGLLGLSCRPAGRARGLFRARIGGDREHLANISRVVRG